MMTSRLLAELLRPGFTPISALWVCVICAVVMTTTDAFFLNKLFNNNNNNKYLYSQDRLSAPETRRNVFTRPLLTEESRSSSLQFSPMTARLVSPSVADTKIYFPQDNNSTEGGERIPFAGNVTESGTNSSVVVDPVQSVMGQDRQELPTPNEPAKELPQNSNNKRDNYETSMIRLIKLASYLDPSQCFPRLVCECEFHNSDPKMAPNIIERLVLKLYGVQSESDRYMKEATMGQTARVLDNPDPCASASSSCSDPLVIQLRQRYNSTTLNS